MKNKSEGGSKEEIGRRINDVVTTVDLEAILGIVC